MKPKGLISRSCLPPFLARGIVALAPSVAWAEVAELLNKHPAMTRAKEMTIAHCKAVIEALSKV
jgi:hypothetical protein